MVAWTDLVRLLSGLDQSDGATLLHFVFAVGIEFPRVGRAGPDWAVDGEITIACHMLGYMYGDRYCGLRYYIYRLCIDVHSDKLTSLFISHFDGGSEFTHDRCAPYWNTFLSTGSPGDD